MHGMAYTLFYNYTDTYQVQVQEHLYYSDMIYICIQQNMITTKF